VHAHAHEHAQGFEHTHDGHTHRHLTLEDVRGADNKITWRSLIVLGISGGLLPCADALAILLLSVSVNRIALGLVLLIAFSLGIALTLTLIGLAAAGGQRVLRRYDRLEPILARLPLASAAVVTVLGLVITYQGALAVGLIH
jgi:ABC-type nickel/cobalt efflux system permease component RcnA